MNPAMGESCHECGATAARLLMCARCQVVQYCSREHQKADFPYHKDLCKRAQQCRELIAREEATLRAKESDDLYLPEDVFVNGEGSFWSIHATRPYMQAKFELIRTMAALDSHTAATVGLREALDSLRLCRGDNQGVRDVVPSLMLALGQLQECYDFIKWWATCDPDGLYEWGNMELPYLDVVGADMFEPIADFERGQSAHFLGALTFIKMALADAVDKAIKANGVVDTATPAGEALRVYLSSGPRSIDQLKALHQTLQTQAVRAFQLTHERNKHYWRGMLDPLPLVSRPDPPFYGLGDPYEIKLWAMSNTVVWRDAHAFIKTQLKAARD